MKNWRSSTSFHPKKRIVKSNADGLLLAKFLNNADDNSGVSHFRQLSNEQIHAKDICQAATPLEFWSRELLGGHIRRPLNPVRVYFSILLNDSSYAWHSSIKLKKKKGSSHEVKTLFLFVET